jgi:hypothetical protein
LHSDQAALQKGNECMPSSLVDPNSHSMIDSNDSDIVITISLARVGWRSYLVAILAGTAFLTAVFLPLWAYRNLKIEFPPIVGDDVGVTTRDQPVNIVVLMNDADPIGTVNLKTVTIERQASHGQVTASPETGIVSYSPEAGFVGRDVFMYSVRNGDGVRSNFGTVQITVNP